MKYEAVKGGLRVARIPGGYAVLHEGSGLPAVDHLRQRRFAEQARDELLATGVDFTQDKGTLQLKNQFFLWSEVCRQWQRRTKDQGDDRRGLDSETFEHYPEHTSYGQFIPSAAQAEEMRKLAGRLRAVKRAPADQMRCAETSRYLDEFKRMGLAYEDEGQLIWTGAKA